ncbi:Nuclear receptor-binding -like protein [Halotydeus destructor]|nr:Nuclear receptor-binding -like protein [Halotydeus destructor]
MENRKNEKRDSRQDDSDEESEILEESPCGRWLKRREELEQLNIPGIDATFLAMDSEEGVEVVWNEVILNRWDSRTSKAREERIKSELDRLVQLDHPNIVKLHKYWTDISDVKARVILITEYMSSGSLKQFLKKTKRNVIKMALPAWKRWCTQMLSALCYLHSSYPPIIHGNLTCDTIFISHNGLIKINAIAPNIIHRTVRSVREDIPANMHFVAPEIGIYKEETSFYVAPVHTPISPAIDIFSFGICALEMAALEITSNSESSQIITQETIYKTIESLDNPLQKDFIRACLSQLPVRRPPAKKLLFHPVIFEVPSLRLLSAHVIVNTPSYQPEQLTEEALNPSLLEHHQPETILAEVKANETRPAVTIKISDAPRREMEKFFEEVRNGAHPLTALVPTYHPPLVSRHRTTSPELAESPDLEEEHRRVASVQCSVRPHDSSDPAHSCSNSNTSSAACPPSLSSAASTAAASATSNTTITPSNCECSVTLVLRLDDKMNRQLSCEWRSNDSAKALVEELFTFGLIHADDRELVTRVIEDSLCKSKNSNQEVVVESNVSEALSSNCIQSQQSQPV